MSGLWINWLFLIFGILALIGGIVLVETASTSYGLQDGLGWFSVIVGIVVAAFAGVVLLVCTLVPMTDKTACSNWGKSAERETKFVRPTYWEWDCLVQTDEGWTSRDNVMKVDE